MKFFSVSAIALAALVAGSSAQAAEMYSSITGNDALRILNEMGLDGTLGVDNEGDPMIRGTIQGYKYTLFFYRCNVDKNGNPVGEQRTTHTGNCLDLQFHSTFTNDTNVNYSVLNAYNRDNRFGQAFFAENGEIGLDMSATLQGGVTRQHIKEVFDWWKVTLTRFPEKVGGGN
jgi:hypothetical protein